MATTKTRPTLGALTAACVVAFIGMIALITTRNAGALRTTNKTVLASVSQGHATSKLAVAKCPECNCHKQEECPCADKCTPAPKLVHVKVELPMCCTDFKEENQQKFKCALAEVRLCIL